MNCLSECRIQTYKMTEIGNRSLLLLASNGMNFYSMFRLAEMWSLVMAPVWDCFARLDPGIHAESPSFLCYPTRPHDELEAGVFQDAPNFCYFRPRPPNFVVHFHAPHGKSYRWPSSFVAGVAQESIPMTLGDSMVMCGMRVLARVGGSL